MKEGSEKRTVLFNLLLAGLISSPVPAAEEPGWYVFEIEDGSLTGKLLRADEACYLLQFQGSVLEVAKGRVQGLKKPALPSKAPARGGESLAESEARAARILDAIELLASGSTSASDQAYAALAKEIEDSRPLLHAALGHQDARVRALITKLLGEVGTADKDLAPVTERLSDPLPQVRLASIMAMRRLGRRGTPALLAHLKRESVPNNRKMAVKTLQIWNDRSAVGPLLEYQAIEKHRGVQLFIDVALESLIGRRGRSPGAWEAHLKKIRQRELNRSTRVPQNAPKTAESASSFAD